MAKTKQRPNVVLFFTDQQRHDASSLHGNPLDTYAESVQNTGVMSWRSNEASTQNSLLDIRY
jgi:hypothetical protein